MFTEDDGLEYYYQFKDEEGKKMYLLSNNLPLKDRENLEMMYKGYVRNQNINSAIGFLGGLEIYRRLPCKIRNAGLAI